MWGEETCKETGNSSRDWETQCKTRYTYPSGVCKSGVCEKTKIKELISYVWQHLTKCLSFKVHKQTWTCWNWLHRSITLACNTTKHCIILFHWKENCLRINNVFIFVISQATIKRKLEANDKVIEHEFSKYEFFEESFSIMWIFDPVRRQYTESWNRIVELRAQIQAQLRLADTLKKISEAAGADDIWWQVKKISESTGFLLLTSRVEAIFNSIL